MNQFLEDTAKFCLWKKLPSCHVYSPSWLKKTKEKREKFNRGRKFVLIPKHFGLKVSGGEEER